MLPRLVPAACLPPGRPAPRPARRAAPAVHPAQGRTFIKKLLNRLNLEALATVDRQRAETEIRTLVFELMAEEATPVSMAEREQILSDILDEVFGLGPLEPLLRDPNINDILVNTYKQVYIERARRPHQGADDVPGRPPSAARHRPHRLGGRPPRRRQLADGGRAPGGRHRASTRSSRRSPSTARCSRSGDFRRSG